MDFAKAGWLVVLLDEEVAKHSRDELLRSIPESELRLSGRARARKFLRKRMRTSGLLYGTPMAAEGEKARAPEETLFLAVVRTFARIGLDIAELTRATPGPRTRQLLLLFASLAGDLELAEELELSLRTQKPEAQFRKLGLKVESELERRAMSLTGDPAYGLVLHNGATYSDAQLFGRQAIDYFSRAVFHRRAAERRGEQSARQKALLVEVLVALAGVENPPAFPTRRAILRQIEDLQLPARVDALLRQRVKQSFERRPSLRAVVKGVRSTDMRRFILEQTILSSLVDGSRSPRELAFIEDLANSLEFSAQDRWGVEVEMAEFYARNRSVVDVFTVSAGAGVMGEELVESMQRTLEKNFQRLMKEIRQTGELSVLLTRAARGQSLSTEERRRMRAQLIDVAKAIPALAIFAAPGGLLLLIALAKVMPFNLLPSSFQDPPAEGPQDSDSDSDSY